MNLVRQRGRPFDRVLLWCVLAGAGLIHHFGVAGLRFPSVRSDPVERPPARVFLMSPDPSETRSPAPRWESSMLLDSSPLFLPTWWNVGALYEGLGEWKEPVLFPPLPDQATRDPQILLAPFESLFPPSETLAGLMELNPPAPADLPRWLASRAPGPSPPPSGVLGRLANLEILPMDRPGGRVLRWLEGMPTVPAMDRPPEPSLYHVFLGHGGPVGPPLLVVGSGMEPYDEQLGDWLQHAPWHRGLPAGYYAIRVLP